LSFADLEYSVGRYVLEDAQPERRALVADVSSRHTHWCAYMKACVTFPWTGRRDVGFGMTRFGKSWMPR